MARQAIHLGELTERTMNGGASYRVALSYGTFTLSPQKLPNGAVYYYALKRVDGRLFKGYVGRRGDVTRDMIHQATMRLAWAIRQAAGHDGRDNLSRGCRP